MDLVDALDFDPSQGTVIRLPPGRGYGYWVGGHKVSFDPADGTFLLFYRERRPLESGRGGEAAVARSTDGISFDDIWRVDKADLGAASIEVGHVLRDPEGSYRLYLSYEREASGGRWQVDLITAKDPARFDPQHRRTVLHPFDYGLGWVKDPFVVLREGEFWTYVAVPARPRSTTNGRRISARPLDATAVARSDDGVYFPALEYVFEAPGTDRWDGRRARLDSVFPWGGGWAATYDGGRTSYDNYEEWAGLATSPDGLTFVRVTSDAPWVRSPYGSVRYVYVLPLPDRVFVYYEYTRADGSHDLRVTELAPFS